MKKLFIILTLAVSLIGCKKENTEKEKETETKQDCDIYNYGIYTIENTYQESVIIYIDNVERGIIAGKSSKTFNIPIGFKNFVCTNNNVPINHIWSASISKCQDYTKTLKEEVEDCEINNYGFYTIQNENKESVTVYIDRVEKGTIAGKSSKTFNVPIGLKSFLCVNNTVPLNYEWSASVSKCQKYTMKLNEKQKEDCEIYQYGFVTIKNTSSNPYDFYVNGTLQKRLTGGTSITFNIQKGSNKLYAKQVSGYILYPTECNQTLTVETCKKYNWTIP